MKDYKINKKMFKIEFFAGLSTFLASMYIIIVNPAILSQAGMPFSAVLTSTVLLSFFGSVMMGVYAKNPILVAPGMGMNAFFTFTAVKTMGIPYQTALGAVFWAGVIFIALSVFNIRALLLQSIPKVLRLGIAAGIGLFITLIGFENAHFIISNPATLISIADLHDPVIITFIVGLLLTAILVSRQVKGAIVIGVLAISIAAYPIGRWWGDATAINFGQKTLVEWKGLFAKPDFSLLFKLDLIGSLKWSLFPVIFAFVFTDLFDSLSTFVGLSESADLKDENGEPRNLKKSLLTDAFATLSAGILGTSPGTAFIESAVGIEQGGKTGLTAITAGVLFLPFMFLSPLLSMIPAIATAPSLVLVGVFMIKPISKINWEVLDDAIPAFLAMVLIPFTYSITQGIIWGFLSFTILKICNKKSQEIPHGLWFINGLILIALMLGH